LGKVLKDWKKDEKTDYVAVVTGAYREILINPGKRQHRQE
jgi:hypothetical protein